MVRQKCPAGTILRSSYVRRPYTRSDGTHVAGSIVKASCIIDKGAPGKTPKSKRVLPKPIPGGLGKYGYSNIKKTLARDRRKALTKAVKNESYATIIRRLNLIANYNKNSDPVTHKIMRSDIAWMQRHLRP